MTPSSEMQLAGKYHPLHNRIEVVVDPARFTRDVSVETTYHELGHTLEFTQTPEEQRLLVEACPGEAAVKRFLAEHPKIAARTIVALGSEAWQDPVGVFGSTYAARMVRGERVAKTAEHAFRRFRSWIEREIHAFEKLPAAERWRQVERNPRAEIEVPFLNGKRGLLAYGSAVDRAREASPTFKRAAERYDDGGLWIERCHMEALKEELRKAGYVARVYGPAAAFYDGAMERVSHEESVAYCFCIWAAKREIGEPERLSTLDTIMVTVERLIHWRGGRGFQCLEDVFECARLRMTNRPGAALPMPDGRLSGRPHGQRDLVKS